jgi:hypothetical protein
VWDVGFKKQLMFWFKLYIYLLIKLLKMKFNLKSICLIFVSIFISTISFAQVGIGTNSPDASAKLDISSTTQGFLPPRMTYAQRQAISSPATGLMIYCTNCGPGQTQVYDGSAWVNMIGGTALTQPPTVASTTAASSITITSAISGGNITNDFGNTIAARGVCWSTLPSPTTADSKTTESGTTGSFTSNITGLTASTLYYVRAYATSAGGTSYGAQVSFTTSALPQIGNSYQGGIVAYILVSGDPGYDANVLHGLIAAPSDQSTGAHWGCDETLILGADGTAIGTGNQNTIDIMAGCATAGIAARICGDLVLGGYSDWYLPSKDELNQLYLNKVAIGSFPFSGGYWSSSEFSQSDAFMIDINNGNIFSLTKSYSLGYVRAIRAF